MNHFNELTPAEAERLAMLSEECAEVIQAVSKILRHGYESVNPLEPEKGTNREQLGRELIDVFAVLLLMQEHDGVADLPHFADQEPDAPDLALARKLKYSHHQKP